MGYGCAKKHIWLTTIDYHNRKNENGLNTYFVGLKLHPDLTKRLGKENPSRNVESFVY